jgi:hypothetical protein
LAIPLRPRRQEVVSRHKPAHPVINSHNSLQQVHHRAMVSLATADHHQMPVVSRPQVVPRNTIISNIPNSSSTRNNHRDST